MKSIRSMKRREFLRITLLGLGLVACGRSNLTPTLEKMAGILNPTGTAIPSTLTEVVAAPTSTAAPATDTRAPIVRPTETIAPTPTPTMIMPPVVDGRSEKGGKLSPEQETYLQTTGLQMQNAMIKWVLDYWRPSGRMHTWINRLVLLVDMKDPADPTKMILVFESPSEFPGMVCSLPWAVMERFQKSITLDANGLPVGDARLLLPPSVPESRTPLQYTDIFKMSKQVTPGSAPALAGIPEGSLLTLLNGIPVYVDKNGEIVGRLNPEKAVWEREFKAGLPERYEDIYRIKWEELGKTDKERAENLRLWVVGTMLPKEQEWLKGQDTSKLDQYFDNRTDLPSESSKGAYLTWFFEDKSDPIMAGLAVVVLGDGSEKLLQGKVVKDPQGNVAIWHLLTDSMRSVAKGIDTEVEPFFNEYKNESLNHKFNYISGVSGDITERNLVYVSANGNVLVYPDKLKGKEWQRLFVEKKIDRGFSVVTLAGYEYKYERNQISLSDVVTMLTASRKFTSDSVKMLMNILTEEVLVGRKVY